MFLGFASVCVYACMLKMFPNPTVFPVICVWMMFQPIPTWTMFLQVYGLDGVPHLEVSMN